MNFPQISQIDAQIAQIFFMLSAWSSVIGLRNLRDNLRDLREN
jgi:hypothetical protein